MNIKYEKYCREAVRNGEITEEQASKIRRYLNSEKNKLQKKRKYREKLGISFIYFSELEAKYGKEFIENIPVSSVNIEEDLIIREEWENLKDCLTELKEKDRWFIEAAFGANSDSPGDLALKTRVSKAAFYRKKKRTVQKLRKLFFQNNEKK